MKILKRIGIVLLALIVLLLIISLFLPSNAHVETTKVLKASPGAVYSQVNNFKNWKSWNPFYKEDTTMEMTYEGPDEGVGAKYSWKSKKMGTGSMIITESVPGQLVTTDLDFGGNGGGKGRFKFEPAENNSTKVTWSMDSELGNNPLHKFMGVAMKMMLGSMFDKGLTDLEKSSTLADIQMQQEQAMPPANTGTNMAGSDTTKAKM